MSEWLHVRTAPKDGTRFLAYDPVLGVITGLWVIEVLPSFEFQALGGDFLEDCEPTHWMPVPSPPGRAWDDPPPGCDLEPEYLRQRREFPDD